MDRPVHRAADRFAAIFARLPLLVAVLWTGMLLGVSFLATPVKFRAASLSLPVALDVGRATFRVFAGVEQGLGILLLIAVLLAGARLWKLGVVLLLGGILVLQAAWLLPALEARIAAIIAGVAPPASLHHMAYAVAETVKLLLLAGLAADGLRR